MAISWRERPDSRKKELNPPRTVLRYTLTGTTSHTYAMAEAVGRTPWVFDGLFRQNVLVDPDGWQVWRIEVPYGPAEPNAQGKPKSYKWHVDTTGGTRRLMAARQHVASYAPQVFLNVAPNHGGAIGVNEDGEVEGAEIPAPQFKWSETHQLPLITASFAYTDLLEAMTPSVNAATFRGKAAGTVLFLGATGGPLEADPSLCEYTFHFSRDWGATGLKFGPAGSTEEITGVNVPPHHVMWVEWITVQDTDANRLVKRPRAVHVERVFDPTDFRLLGIGT